MKKNGKRYKEEPIIEALWQVEGGRQIAEVYSDSVVPEQNDERWKKKYARMGVSKVRRLKQLEEEPSVSEMTAPQVCS